MVQRSLCSLGTSVCFFSKATVTCKKYCNMFWKPLLHSSVLASEHPECYISIHGGKGEIIMLLMHWHKIVFRVIIGNGLFLDHFK